MLKTDSDILCKMKQVLFECNNHKLNHLHQEVHKSGTNNYSKKSINKDYNDKKNLIVILLSPFTKNCRLHLYITQDKREFFFNYIYS